MGRTTDWLSKAENNRIELDRLSVIQTLAGTLGVTVGDLLGEPTLVNWGTDTGRHALPDLRAVLRDYRTLTPLFTAGQQEGEPIGLVGLRRDISAAMDGCQSARYAWVADRFPELLAYALAATRAHHGAERDEAQRLLALAYQATAQVLGKVGEAELAWMAADRGLAAAQQSGDLAVTGSLLRSVMHCLDRPVRRRSEPAGGRRDTAAADGFGVFRRAGSRIRRAASGRRDGSGPRRRSERRT